MRRDFRSSTVDRLLFAGWSALPLLFWALPQQWVMQGPTLCLYRRLTGHPCYGCGLTRALYALLHLDPSAAWNLNRAVVVVAPLLLWLYIKEWQRLGCRVRSSDRRAKRLSFHSLRQKISCKE